MSVIVAKRKPSQFEVFHHLSKMRKEITDLLLRDFGYSEQKQEDKLFHRLGITSYEEMTPDQFRHYTQLKSRWIAYDEWFIVTQRETITNCLRDITKEVYLANSIYPTKDCPNLLEVRRKHQFEAIGYCYVLTQELQYAIETLPVDINKYTRFGNMISKEISLIQGWRKSDKKRFNFKATSDSAANFANVNNNGNSNYNNASNSNGVRPDFDSTIK